MRTFREVVVIIISLFLCPLAHGKAFYHQALGWFRPTIQIYCYDFRYLIFCKRCNKVFVNELSQDEVDELEVFDNPWENDEQSQRPDDK